MGYIDRIIITILIVSTNANTNTSDTTPMTTGPVTTSFVTTFDKLSMNIYGYEIDFCFISSIISEVIALLTIIEFIIFYIYRNEDGIKSRRPGFTYSFCIISIIYFLFIIPAICSEYTLKIEFLPFIGWYLLRCSCIFLWYWTLICKYWFLYFDYNYVILLRLQAMHNINTNINGKNISNPILNTRAASKSLFAPENGATQLKSKWFVKHKRDFGNPKKASLYIGIYFLLCFLVLLCFAIINHSEIDEKYFNNQYIYTSFFTNLQITEIAFIAMCYVPFITAIIFTCRIWGINESWKIKQEILTIFIVAAVIFVLDTILTGWIYIDETTRFTLKLMLEFIILFWTTLISTIFVIIFIIRKRNKSHRKMTTNFNDNITINKRNKLSSELINYQQTTTPPNVIPLNDIDNNNNNNINNDINSIIPIEVYEIPLGYILANQLGYSSFLEHCSEEFNIENLLFLAHVCYFKKKFLDRIKDRQLLTNAKIKKLKDNISKELPTVDENNMNNNTKPLLSEEDNINTNSNMNDDDIDDDDDDDDDINDETDDDLIELQSINTKSPSPLQSRSRNVSHKLDLIGDSKTSFVTIRTDVAVYSDKCSDSEENMLDVMDDIDWSPSNCLAILTFRMCHNFEREHNRLTLIDAQNNNSEYNNEYVPLYVLAINLYNKFVKENSEYEINLPSKIKTKLHFFFHQNFNNLAINDKNNIEYNEYRLFHIFDKSWEEIWKLLTLNSYRRFLNSNHYESIKNQLEIALCDEKPSLYKLIVLDSNNDKHIVSLIESHDPYKRKAIHKNSGNNNDARMHSLNIQEMNQLKPTSLINIGVDPLPIDEQVHHFGKSITKVKKARV